MIANILRVGFSALGPDEELLGLRTMRGKMSEQCWAYTAALIFIPIDGSPLLLPVYHMIPIELPGILGLIPEQLL